MKRNAKLAPLIRLNPKVLTMTFRCFLCLLLISWAILIVNKKIDILKYVSFFGAFVFAGFLCCLFSLRSISEKFKSDFDSAMHNADQAQEILKKRNHLFTKSFSSGIQPYAPASNIFTDESFSDLVQSPITWITCVGVGLILLFHPAYAEVESKINIDIDIASMGKIMALSLLQLLLFGLFFSGVLLVITNFIKKDIP